MGVQESSKLAGVRVNGGVSVYPDIVVSETVGIPAMGTVTVPVEFSTLGIGTNSNGIRRTVNTRSRVALTGAHILDSAAHSNGTGTLPVANYSAHELLVREGQGIGYRVDYDSAARLTGDELTARIEAGEIIPGEQWKWLIADDEAGKRSQRVGVVVKYDTKRGRTRVRDAVVPDGPSAGFRDAIDDMLNLIDGTTSPGYVVYPSIGEFRLNGAAGYIPRLQQGLANGYHLNSRHLDPASRYDWNILFEIAKPPNNLSDEIAIVFFDTKNS